MTAEYGSFAITPAGPFKAASLVTIVMTYTAGTAAIQTGGAVKIGLPNMGWGEPLPPFPRGDHEIYKGQARQICRYKPCNTTARVESNGGAEIRLDHRGSQNMLGPYNNWSWWITATVEAGRLEPGDKLIITYGDTAFGEPGARVQTFAEKDRVWFCAFADPAGSGMYAQASGSPVDTSVIPGDLEKAMVTIPSIVRPGTSFALRLALTDWGMDAVPGHAARVTAITAPDRTAVSPGRMCADSPVGRLEGLPAGAGGRCTVTVQTRDNRETTGQSNPAIIRPAGPFLYWGDLHTHSFYHQYNEKLGYGDPCTSPAEQLQYAREVSHLDFIALTDGRGALPDNAGWQEQQQAVIDNYREGQFVTLKGWEVQMGTDGHRNAIYRTTAIEDNYDHAAFRDASIWGGAGTGMQGVIDYFKGRDDVFLIPHHPLVWMNWDVFDPAIDRLAEIYSCWGSSEAPGNDYWDKASLPGLSITDGLTRKYRFGFAGGSDSHTGYPGRSLPDADRYRFCRYKAGYTGVYAEALTREAVWDALYSRYTYATTGARLIAACFVDGLRMGAEAEVNARREQHTVRFEVQGTAPVERIDIIRDGATAHTIRPYAEYIHDEWIDTTGAARTAGFYYLRITQVDGERAWTSPTWVK